MATWRETRSRRRADQEWAVSGARRHGYIKQRPDEVEVLFTLMAERYERRSLMISSNLVFSEWDQIFQNPMTTAAAVDRLVHYSAILEFDVPSYRTAAKLSERDGGDR